jgi:CubicO group peptidase (beta-lactamase class C family)
MTLKLRTICLKFSLLLGFLLLLQPVFSQYSFSDVDNIVAKNQKALGNNVVALIWKDGKIVYQKEVGEDFKIKTQAPIGASSAWFTAALVMTFVDEGKISLDDPVTKYIPIFESYSKKYITIRNCLTHTTGIEAEPGIKAILQRKKFPTLEEEVISYAKREIERNPNEMFFYSSIGLNIAARICEIVSKKPFDRLIQERVLRPLKMRNTTFYVDYDKAIDPTSGALSTANDYIIFMSMLLNKGMTPEGTKRILSEASIAEMQKMQTGSAVLKYVPLAAQGYSYGYGDWIMATDSKGNATAVSNPALSGTWPMIDYCRGYAFILFVKPQSNELKQDLYTSLKDAIDQQIPCK